MDDDHVTVWFVDEYMRGIGYVQASDYFSSQQEAETACEHLSALHPNCKFVVHNND